MRENEKHMFDFGGTGRLGRHHLDGGQVRHLRHPLCDAAGSIPGLSSLFPFGNDSSLLVRNRPQGPGMYQENGTGYAKNGCKPSARGALILAPIPGGGQPATLLFPFI